MSDVRNTPRKNERLHAVDAVEGCVWAISAKEVWAEQSTRAHHGIQTGHAPEVRAPLRAAETLSSCVPSWAGTPPTGAPALCRRDGSPIRLRSSFNDPGHLPSPTLSLLPATPAAASVDPEGYTTRNDVGATDQYHGCFANAACQAAGLGIIPQRGSSGLAQGRRSDEQ